MLGEYEPEKKVYKWEVVQQIDNGKYVIFLDKTIRTFVSRWVHSLY